MLIISVIILLKYFVTVIGRLDKIVLKPIKSFCLRDRGRLGNEGQPILLKIGTQSHYVDLCNMPKF